MLEGLWIVQFAGMEGKGGGVVVLTKGKALGGDSAFSYVGSYKEDPAGMVQAHVNVHNFDPQIGNVLGIIGDFFLDFKLTPQGDGTLSGQASTPQKPGFGLKAKLTLVEKL